ncbi:hypothetical protein M8C21_015536, partial [Ambrosia artemisiifolia]
MDLKMVVLFWASTYDEVVCSHQATGDVEVDLDSLAQQDNSEMQKNLAGIVKLDMIDDNINFSSCEHRRGGMTGGYEPGGTSASGFGAFADGFGKTSGDGVSTSASGFGNTFGGGVGTSAVGFGAFTGGFGMFGGGFGTSGGGFGASGGGFGASGGGVGTSGGGFGTSGGGFGTSGGGVEETFNLDDDTAFSQLFTMDMSWIDTLPTLGVNVQQENVGGNTGNAQQ